MHRVPSRSGWKWQQATTVSLDGSSVATVVKIKLGVAAKATAETVRTRGTPPEGMATLTIEEGFKGLLNGDDLEIEVRGIPNGATWHLAATANPLTGRNDWMTPALMDTPTPWLWGRITADWRRRDGMKIRHIDCWDVLGDADLDQRERLQTNSTWR